MKPSKPIPPLTPEKQAAFWARFDRSAGECWTWSGTRTPTGYGIFQLAKTNYVASRVAYTLTYGPIADGLLVCHHCDNPPCGRPDHLFLGDYMLNVIDRVAKGRNAWCDPVRNGLHAHDENPDWRPPASVAIAKDLLRKAFLRNTFALTAYAAAHGLTVQQAAKQALAAWTASQES